jgi:hypothetical protein
MLRRSWLEDIDNSSRRLLCRRLHHQKKAQRTMAVKMTQTRPRVTDRPIFVDEVEEKAVGGGEAEDEDEMDSDRV